VNKSIRIVIAALGGEGGGVLGKWIADMAAQAGYVTQTTSVPGVAQRTGATIYYIEIFRRSETGNAPVMSMFPTPGDVDIVICSEIVEAGRMIQRGFVTPDRTTLISSTHRVYGIAEKEAMGNGIGDKNVIIEVAKSNAKTFIGFDMQAAANRFGSVINAALFGALAETGVLPFERTDFEETISLGKIAVESNLKTFTASYELAGAQQDGVTIVEPEVQSPVFELPVATTQEGRALMLRVASFPESCQETLYLGVKKLVHYQDYRYADQYLDQLQAIMALETDGDYELLSEVARFLALWMTFEDLPRVAQLKISGERFSVFRKEVKADQDQLLGMVEFLHPRVEEFCGVMPVAMGEFMQNSAFFSRILGLFAGPRNVRTNSVYGYAMFYFMAKLRNTRRSSLIYQVEQAHINTWLTEVVAAARTDYDSAVELARCGRLIKGYSATRERGNANLQKIVALYKNAKLSGAKAITAARNAALADDEGEAMAQFELGLEA
jgi:indolepyruvate ferredoxin oxidoreductase beta subunit